MMCATRWCRNEGQADNAGRFYCNRHMTEDGRAIGCDDSYLCEELHDLRRALLLKAAHALVPYARAIESVDEAIKIFDVVQQARETSVRAIQPPPPMKSWPQTTIQFFGEGQLEIRCGHDLRGYDVRKEWAMLYVDATAAGELLPEGEIDDCFASGQGLIADPSKARQLVADTAAAVGRRVRRPRPDRSRKSQRQMKGGAQMIKAGLMARVQAALIYAEVES